MPAYATLPPNSSLVYTIDANLAATLANSNCGLSTITNQANVYTESSGGLGNRVNYEMGNTVSTIVNDRTPCPSYDMKVEVKTPPASPVTADNFEWEVTYTNVSAFPTPYASIQAKFRNNLTLSSFAHQAVACSATGGAQCPDLPFYSFINDPASSANSATFGPSGSGSGDWPPGASMTVRYRVSDFQCPKLSSTDLVFNLYEDVGITNGLVDVNTSNNESLVTVKAKCVDLAVNKTQSASTATQGDIIEYVITSSNAGGNITVSGSKIVDYLPAGLAFVSATCDSTTPGDGTICAPPVFDPTTNSVSADVPTLIANGSAKMRLFVRAIGQGSFTNRAKAILPAGLLDTSIATNTGTQNLLVTGPAVTADLGIAKAGPANLHPGGGISYTLTATNTSSIPIGGALITDQVSGYISKVVWSCTGSGGATCSSSSGAGNNIAVPVDFPATGGSIIITITGVVSSSYTALTLTNTATINPPSGTSITDSNPSNNSSNTVAQNSDVPTLVKAFNPALIAPGGVSRLTFTVTGGTADSFGLGFTDTFPPSIKVAPVPNAQTNCTGAVLTALAGSGSFSVQKFSLKSGATCTVSVDVSSASIGTFVNQKSNMSLTNLNADTLNATLQVKALQPANLAKAFSPSPVLEGGTSVLTFTLTNPAANVNTLSGINFTDTLPSGITVKAGGIINNACGSGSITTSTNAITVTGVSLAPNASCTITVEVTGNTVGSYVNAPGNFSNAANVSTANINANLDVRKPVAALTKAFTPASIGVGGISTLQLTLTNSDTAFPINGAGFTDNLPPDLFVAGGGGNANSTCPGVNITTTSNTIAVSSVNLAAGASCIIAVDVTSSATRRSPRPRRRRSSGCVARCHIAEPIDDHVVSIPAMSSSAHIPITTGRSIG